MIRDTASAYVDRIEPITVRVPEAARILSISRASLYRLLSSGEIEAAKSGQKTLVIVESLKAFVERHRVQMTSAIPE